MVEACKLNLSNSPSPSSSSSTSLFSSPYFTSILFEPKSLSLALMHSDFSVSLYPSLSPFSISSTPSHLLTLIPPHISSSTFLLLHPKPNSTNPNPPRTLFVVAGPHISGASILLRFYVLCTNKHIFTKSHVVCTQKDLKFDENLGVVVNASHGVSVKLYGSINVLAMYMTSNSKIWIFSAKIIGYDVDHAIVRLMKCAVIECCVPVWSLSISYGYLILGENNGVRIYALRPLVKGRVKKNKKEKKDLNSRVVIQGFDVDNDNYSGLSKHGNGVRGRENPCIEGTAMENYCNGHLNSKIDTHHSSVKLRSVKLRQDSCSLFVAFKDKEVDSSVKAISIQALSPNKYMILDSIGHLHLLHLSNPVLGSNITFSLSHLIQTMKVQNLAVLPDISLTAGTVWISDGSYTVYMMNIYDRETTSDVNDKPGNTGTLMQLSVNRAIFVAEEIQEIVLLSTNAILILGQGSVFAYELS